jgi:hypothetical protein
MIHSTKRALHNALKRRQLLLKDMQMAYFIAFERHGRVHGDL